MSRSTPLSSKARAARSRQTGATLIVGLVLLLVLTVLGVSGMNTATMQVTMAGNMQFQQDAFQMAEDGIDIAIGTLDYTTDEDRTVPWLGDPDIDRSAVTRYQMNTLAPGFSGGAVEAFHFDTTSVGRGPRNGTSTHTQSFYVVGQAL
jgi:hypothetical protein